MPACRVRVFLYGGAPGHRIIPRGKTYLINFFRDGRQISILSLDCWNFCAIIMSKRSHEDCLIALKDKLHRWGFDKNNLAVSVAKSSHNIPLALFGCHQPIPCDLSNLLDHPAVAERIVCSYTGLVAMRTVCIGLFNGRTIKAATTIKNRAGSSICIPVHS